MKKVIAMLMLVFCLVSPVQADDPNDSLSLWILGGPSLDSQNNEIGFLGGLRKGNTEVGIAALWRMFTEADTMPDEQSEFAIGIYNINYLPKVLDVNNPLPIPGLPEKIVSEPYFGLKFLKDLEGKGTAISPLAGVRVFETIGVMYEYRGYNGVDVADKSLLTLSIRFRY